MPQKMRVSNCHEYNKFLQERGNIFYYVNDAIENWYEKGPKMAVGKCAVVTQRMLRIKQTKCKSYTIDEGGPLGAGLQEQASNSHELLW